MSHHHKTMEVGGWTLLVAAISVLLYLLFHKDGQAALTGNVSVKSVETGGCPASGCYKTPAITPNDPTAQSSFMDSEGTIWLWNPTGKQWTVSGASSQRDVNTMDAGPFLA